jgi:PKD repeat protein
MRRQTIAVLTCTAIMLPAAALLAATNPSVLTTAELRSATSGRSDELIAALDRKALAEISGGSARVLENLPLSDGTTVDVQLEPYSPLAAGATLLEMTDTGPVEHRLPVDELRFRGVVLEHPEWIALFRVSGESISGFIEADGTKHLYGVTTVGGARKMTVRRHDPARRPARIGHCDLDQLAVPAPLGNVAMEHAFDIEIERSTDRDTLLEVEVAIEMDWESYDHFGSVADAASYAIDLIGAVSLFYERDVDVVMTVSSIRVWSTPADPYPDGNSTVSLLYALQAEYGDTMTGVERATAVLLSRRWMGGVAWLDALCSGAYGYAVVGIDGAYSYPTSAYTWDADATAHEIGHNFGSVHTHCYPPPYIDRCYNEEDGCFDGQVVASIGTIMSYCHLVAGKNLVFHERVQPVVRSGAENAWCVSAASGDVGLFAAGAPEQVCGDDDGNIEPGEHWSVPIAVRNGGEQTRTGVTGSFAVTSPAAGVQLESATVSFGDLEPSTTATSAVTLLLDADASCGASLQLDLTGITWSGGSAPGSSGVFAEIIGGGVACDSDASCGQPPMPVAAFTSQTSVCAGSTVQFTDASSNAESWEWDFDGDGTVDSTEQSPTHTYASPGVYTCRLEAFNDDGAQSASISSEIVVIDPTSATPGDASANGQHEAADLVATLSELADGDGSAVADRCGGWATTDQVDVDGDSQVTENDLLQSVVRLFDGSL